MRSAKSFHFEDFIYVYLCRMWFRDATMFMGTRHPSRPPDGTKNGRNYKLSGAHKHRVPIMGFWLQNCLFSKTGSYLKKKLKVFFLDSFVESNFWKCRIIEPNGVSSAVSRIRQSLWILFNFSSEFVPFLWAFASIWI